WAILPFIIFAGKHHLSAYSNGWTTNELSYFEKYIKNRTVGARHLLIINSHESHDSLEFQQLCKEKSIITLYMLSHSSHLLQPLDVGCFVPLKKAYGRQIEDLMRCRIHHITKLKFLPAFRAAY
ncbi:CENP-B protein, partial [Zopfia rhizophila CBS 207.26]